MVDVLAGKLYRKTTAKTIGRDERGVWYWDEGERGKAAQFHCPCGDRLVYVTSPPHAIAFREDGVLASLGGSCGYRAKEGRPQNWCHFTITDGVAAMHSDSKCPGACGG